MSSINTLLKLFPAIWNEIFKYIPYKQFRKIRQVNKAMNFLLISTGHFYKHHLHSLLESAIKYNDISLICRLPYNCNVNDACQAEKIIKIIETTQHLYFGTKLNTFEHFAVEGDLETLRALYAMLNKDGQERIIRFKEYSAFRLASTVDHFMIVQQLCAWCSSLDRIAMIKAQMKYGAAGKGQMFLISQIYEWSEEEQREWMVKSVEYFSFIWACMTNINILQRASGETTSQSSIHFNEKSSTMSTSFIPLSMSEITEKSTRTQRSLMISLIKSHQYFFLRWAAIHGNLAMVQVIYSWCSEEDRERILKRSREDDFLWFSNTSITDQFDFWNGERGTINNNTPKISWMKRIKGIFDRGKVDVSQSRID